MLKIHSFFLEERFAMKKKALRRFFTVLSLVFLTISAPVTASEIRTERVHFKKGSSSAVVEDSISGDATADYVLGAKKGQYMNVSMATDNAANYFNILAPGEEDAAFFIGSTSGNQYEGVLPENGDYKIRVYLMRSAARRNEVAKYRLEMIITNAEETSSAVESGSSGSDALVPGTNYHATGDIPCGMGGGQPTGACPFGVVREGNGSGVVTVTKPDGRTRSIFFENGEAVGYDASQADPGEFSARREGDLNIIRIGDERYQIPDAVIFGG
jgi:hypothetical protein